MIKGDYELDESKLAQNLHAAHKRLRTRRGKASEHDCVDCGGQAKDWSRMHEETGFSSEHYEPRCRSCHVRYDWTPERSAKIAEKQRANPSGWPSEPRKHTEETKEKMRQAALRRKI